MKKGTHAKNETQTSSLFHLTYFIAPRLLTRLKHTEQISYILSWIIYVYKGTLFLYFPLINLELTAI
jgi:hypothetical protein